jgi:MFS family permease
MGDVGLRASMMYLGTGFLVVVSLLAQFLVNPRERLGGIALPVSDSAPDIGFAQLVRTPTAWLIWATFFVGAGTGLMLIGIVTELVRPSLGTSAYIAVVVLALGNASGRLVGGLVSDRFGRRLSLATTLLAQAVFMFLAALIAGAQHAPAIFCLAVVALVGFTFGSLLALYPAVTKDHFGMRHFGSNYAAIFTAWGVGGFVMSHLAQSLYAAAHSHRPACFFACAMLVVSCGLTLLLPDARPASRRSS